MQDRTINNALLALRRQGGEARELAERLLAMRGVECLPRMIPKPARRGEMQRLVLEAIKSGRTARAQIVAFVAERRPEAPPDRLYWRVDAALAKLRKKGLLTEERKMLCR